MVMVDFVAVAGVDMDVEGKEGGISVVLGFNAGGDERSTDGSGGPNKSWTMVEVCASPSSADRSELS